MTAPCFPFSPDQAFPGCPECCFSGTGSRWPFCSSRTRCNEGGRGGERGAGVVCGHDLAGRVDGRSTRCRAQRLAVLGFSPSSTSVRVLPCSLVRRWTPAAGGFHSHWSWQSAGVGDGGDAGAGTRLGRLCSRLGAAAAEGCAKGQEAFGQVPAVPPHLGGNIEGKALPSRGPALLGMGGHDDAAMAAWGSGWLGTVTPSAASGLGVPRVLREPLAPGGP